MPGILRQILFITDLIVTTVIGAIIVIIIGIFNPYSPINIFIERLWCRLILLLAGVKLEVEGLENVNPDQSYVIVGNHQSHMDIPVIFTVLPLRLTAVSKKELFKIPFFGWGMKAVGVLKIDRQNSAQAIQTINESEKILRKHKLSLVAFPEGTRSPDGHIHRFKKGPFVFAIRSGLPILPVTIKGTYHILPKKRLWVKPGHVWVKIHPPVDPSPYSFEDRDALVERVHEMIKNSFYHEATVVS